MKGELISVIIPVYNVEPYLEKCVESVLAQTYEDLEVILVDDGSPDGCPALCDAFARRDSRVRVIHKENGGQGSARNRGLDIARGAYIGFVDSDDYIAPDMYEKLYTALTDTGADISICDLVFVDADGNRTFDLPPMRAGTLTREQMYERLETVEKGRYVVVCTRLCRRELFEGLRFEEGKGFEDEFLVLPLYRRCSRVALIADVLYYYLQRQGSTMNRPVTIRHLEAVQAIMGRWDYYHAHGHSVAAKRALHYAYVTLWKVMNGVDAWGERRALWPYVRRVMAAQVRELNVSAGMLLLGYVRALWDHRPGARTDK